MRKPRGNIILTALFVAVFLFFLSIALIWTNRQDIALSLTMEHKVKAEAAARSGAMAVYGALRSFGQPPSALEQKLDSGASWRVELVELPPEPKRGPMLLVRSRGTSGPLSAYYTLHLQKTQLGSEGSEDVGRMLGFFNGPSGGPAAEPVEEPSDEETPAAEATPAAEMAAKTLFGDFELKDADIKIKETDRFAASGGPLFVSTEQQVDVSPLQVVAHLPVLYPTGLEPKAYGPIIMAAPKIKAENVLRVLNYESETFTWTDIPAPVVEPDLESITTPPIAFLEMIAGDSWTTANARSLIEVGTSFWWRDDEPATEEESETKDLDRGVMFEIQLGGLIDWATAPEVAPVRTYSMNGAIAARKTTVYSFAFEYLYVHYDGGAPAIPIDPVVGSTITRWPCVRSYNTEDKTWATAWSALKDNGDVKSTLRPDITILKVDSQGVCYSRTKDAPYRLLTLTKNGNVERGDEIPGNGNFFIYQDEPYVISPDANKPGLLSLKTDKLIDFSSLPNLLPEIAGPVITSMPNENPEPGTAPLDISSLDGSTEDDPIPESRTVRHPYYLRYRVDPSADIVSDDKDLYCTVSIEMEKGQASFDTIGNFDLGSGTYSCLARYDGERWHIMPHGLMAAVTAGMSAPGNRMFCARYDGLPTDVPRYTVIATSTDYFKMSTP